jgi:hypothetical protein
MMFEEVADNLFFWTDQAMVKLVVKEMLHWWRTTTFANWIQK